MGRGGPAQARAGTAVVRAVSPVQWATTSASPSTSTTADRPHSAVDVLLALWGRSAVVDVEGDADVVAHWTGLTARTTAVPARA